jgi:hypothetical protein
MGGKSSSGRCAIPGIEKINEYGIGCIEGRAINKKGKATFADGCRRDG